MVIIKKVKGGKMENGDKVVTDTERKINLLRYKVLVL